MSFPIPSVLTIRTHLSAVKKCLWYPAQMEPPFFVAASEDKANVYDLFTLEDLVDAQPASTWADLDGRVYIMDRTGAKPRKLYQRSPYGLLVVPPEIRDHALATGPLRGD